MCEEETAYHECGHAYVAHLLGATVHALTIDPDRDDGPRRFGDATIHWPVGRWSDAEWRKRAISVALAGPVAEMIHRGEPLHPAFQAEWSMDWKVAWELAASLHVTEAKRLQFLEQATRDLHRLLSQDDHWCRLATLVDALLAHETLEEEQIQEALDAWE